jgi:hypothetical protein
MKFLILHGSFGSPQSNWFPWLKSQLENRRHKVLTPQMPIDDWEEANRTYKETGNWDATNQNLDHWLQKFEKDIQPWLGNERPIIIAHSLSPLFVLHLVDKLNIKLKAAIFVSPFYQTVPAEGPYDIANRTFYYTDFDWNKIVDSIEYRFVFYSDNDPFIDQVYFQNFINKTQSQSIVIHSRGHLGEELEEFPEVLNTLEQNNLI